MTKIRSNIQKVFNESKKKKGKRFWVQAQIFELCIIEQKQKFQILEHKKVFLFFN